MHEALLIDLDGVLRSWAGQRTGVIERRHGLPPGSLTAVAFAPERLLPAVTGRVTDADWRAGVAEELTRRHGAGGADAVREWSAPVGEADADVLQLVRAQRRVRTVALLSNATDRLRSDLRALSLDEEFDVVFSSAELGVAKPERAVFTLACAALGLAPEQCLFVDDSAEHVAAAAQVGLEAHHFRSAAELSAFLARCG
ncbi:putative hydrolase of the HAD superfamily [Blastococcus aurantiacus]|uniref:Putative hydrolase of the HAD superfamily n=1 Tax=Blastococcus aurantiacus TaxID=1550231 RepID=A0A1G7KUM1_9ACTN|nr:HAD-IA family hydrolase [Blastococcus aurantiacus]SDF40630.1 putative hydrolase of the HAD superfamily [Blastococcus aurantiacus]